MRQLAEVVALSGRPYTRRMPGPFDGCQICGEAFSYSLSRCPLCHRTVCDSCAVRRGGCVFCGTECAHAFFFGESDEDSETPEAQREE
jgi:hypothetical protein